LRRVSAEFESGGPPVLCDAVVGSPFMTIV